MDCDLSRSYLDTFEFIWPRLSMGGMIHLDEYCPPPPIFLEGPVAIDELVGDKCARLEMAMRTPGAFQWQYVTREVQLSLLTSLAIRGC